jgi:serine/threonine-protein kinase RsbT
MVEKIPILKVGQALLVSIQVDMHDRLASIEQAMRDGYSTGTRLGLGLSGSKRLMNDFEIESKPGEGTRVSVAKWK